MQELSSEFPLPRTRSASLFDKQESMDIYNLVRKKTKTLYSDQV